MGKTHQLVVHAALLLSQALVEFFVHALPGELELAAVKNLDLCFRRRVIVFRGQYIGLKSFFGDLNLIAVVMGVL